MWAAYICVKADIPLKTPLPRDPNELPNSTLCISSETRVNLSMIERYVRYLCAAQRVQRPEWNRRDSVVEEDPASGSHAQRCSKIINLHPSESIKHTDHIESHGLMRFQ